MLRRLRGGRLFEPEREWAVALAPLLLASTLFVGAIGTHDVTIVEGTSMMPTLHTEDRLLVSRDYDSPHRQDIVIFDEDDGFDSSTLVKRVVAVSGDAVLVLGDRVLVNGVPEPPHGMTIAEDSAYLSLQVVPSGHVWVMGDNRPDSLDSRILGPVKIGAIKGKVVAILGPLGRMRPSDAF